MRVANPPSILMLWTVPKTRWELPKTPSPQHHLPATSKSSSAILTSATSDPSLWGAKWKATWPQTSSSLVRPASIFSSFWARSTISDT